jgi:hypothetical protein
MLVAPSGEVVLSSGCAEVDVDRVARLAAGLGAATSLVSFADGTSCVHAAPVCMGWTLCVLSTAGVSPGLVIERLQRASAVLAMALVDGVARGSGDGGQGPDGAPAVVFAGSLPARKN